MVETIGEYMEPTSRSSNLRSLLIFFVIGAILLAAVILGVRWARGRSDQLATKPTSVATDTRTDAQKQADEQKKAEDQRKAAEQRAADDKKKADEEKARKDAAAAQQSKNNENKVATASPVSPAQQATPARVPSTGIEDAFLPIAALAALVFSAVNYRQSRRRLLRLS